LHVQYSIKNRKHFQNAQNCTIIRNTVKNHWKNQKNKKGILKLKICTLTLLAVFQKIAIFIIIQFCILTKITLLRSTKLCMYIQQSVT